MSDSQLPDKLDLILASSSRYRRDLLRRLIPTFRAISPEVDESALPGEAPQALAQRLALTKARAVSEQHPTAIVIGSDQVAALDAQTLGKPGDHERARAQLALCSGKTVQFHTAVCVSDGRSGRVLEACDTTQVTFRTLHEAEIERYLRIETPYDCAGSFKAEGAGIALFERIRSDDPTALIGLPLIALSRLLREIGVAPF